MTENNQGPSFERLLWTAFAIVAGCMVLGTIVAVVEAKTQPRYLLKGENQ